MLQLTKMELKSVKYSEKRMIICLVKLKLLKYLHIYQISIRYGLRGMISEAISIFEEINFADEKKYCNFLKHEMILYKNILHSRKIGRLYGALH